MNMHPVKFDHLPIKTFNLICLNKLSFLQVFDTFTLRFSFEVVYLNPRI